MNFRMFLMVFIGLFIFSAMAFAIPASSTPRKVDREEKPIIWLSNVDDGLKLAVTEYKPVLVFFSAKDCNWCKRLSDESLSEGRIKLLLQSYILVKVDAHENSADVNRYRISTVPMLMVMGADGSLRSRMGYGSTEEVEGFLRESLDLRFFTKVSSDLTVYQALLNGDLKEVKPDQWSALVSSLSKPEHRLKLLPLLLALDPFPATEIVSLLEHRLLSVRLGAIELLEELTGKAYDYDPWCFITDGNVKPLLKWKAWTKNTETEKKAVYSAITEEEFQKHIRDLISPNRERSLRARRLLTQGGIDISRMLSVFLESNKGLNQLSANQIQEVQYTMVFQNIADINAEELAHHLVFGNMDDKQRSLRELKKAGMTGFPIVRSYLSANDSLIRESAVDTIVAIGGLEAVNSLALALETETDDDVIHTIIKGLGNIQSRTGLGLLISFLENNNEDLVVTAIASIARLKSKQASDGLKACLKDKRWRVRVAALEAVNSLSLKSLADDVKELLEDEDDFVRSSAIGPYAKLAGKKAVTALESLFLKDDSLKAPVISAFVSLEVAIPESFSPSLEKLDTDNLLKCLGALKGCKVESLHIVKAFTGHVDEDVSSMAIRIIASAGLADKKYQDELLTVLNGSNDVLILAALEGMTSPEKRSSALSGFFEEIKEYFTASEKSDGTDSPAEELLNAFLRPEPVKSTSSDLFSSFMITDSNENRETEDNKKTAAQIAQKIQTWFQGTDNNKFRFLSALFHLISGQIDVVDYLIKELKNQPTQERMVVAGLLSRAKKNEILPLVKVLIDDSSSEVREKAVASAFSLSGELPAILPALFEMLLKDSSNLRPWELSK
jgi:HEAT repeat protein